MTRALGNWVFSAVLSLALGASSFSQTSSSGLATSPGDLIRAVVANELKPQDSPGRWMYKVDKQEDGKTQTKEVVQTRDASLERLTSMDGRALSQQKQQEEAARIEKLVSQASERQKVAETQKKDADQCETFFKMIPDAFIFTYEGRQGELVKIGFKPNPAFAPPSREARVLHLMEGEILVHPTQQRLAAINGRLTQDVKFGGGLLGYLQKGGTFSVKRTEIAPAQWALTAMEVNMNGKALFFKTIAVQEKEYRTNFRKVSDDLTIADAANILLNRVTLAAKQ